MRHFKCLKGKDGLNHVEYSHEDGYIFCLSEKSLEIEDMCKIEDALNIDLTLGVRHISFERVTRSGMYYTVWSYTLAEDCDWS